VTHPITIEHQVQERQQQLRQLAQSAHVAHRARAEAGEVGSWRRRLARALVALGVAVGLPRQRRQPALREAVALLDCCRVT
jgi:hypothetical protein